MISYEVVVQRDAEPNNFLNLRELDEVILMNRVSLDENNNEVYRLESQVNLDRELDLLNEVIRWKHVGPLIS